MTRRCGTIAAELGAIGRLPTVTGPPARDQERTDDPLTWHPMAMLPARAMRRLRRLDVRATRSVIVFDGFFRDSHLDVERTETSIHEYSFDGMVDRATDMVVDLSVGAYALPWIECSQAVSSANQVIGQRVASLRGQMRGTAICTHLNDVLRSLQDLSVLSGCCVAIADAPAVD